MTSGSGSAPAIGGGAGMGGVTGGAAGGAVAGGAGGGLEGTGAGFESGRGAGFAGGGVGLGADAREVGGDGLLVAVAGASDFGRVAVACLLAGAAFSPTLPTGGLSASKRTPVAGTITTCWQRGHFTARPARSAGTIRTCPVGQ